jgi:phosphoserine aminotransferase
MVESKHSGGCVQAFDDPSACLYRIWCGATVEASDLEALMPWLQWAFEAVNVPA